MTEAATSNVLGLAILSLEPKELTVVNFVGSIDLEKVSALEGKMGIPKMKLEKTKNPKKPGGADESRH